MTYIQQRLCMCGRITAKNEIGKPATDFPHHTQEKKHIQQTILRNVRFVSIDLIS